MLRIRTFAILAFLALANPFAEESEVSIRSRGDGDWLTGVQSAIELAEYHASMSPAGLQAPNRAQNFRTYFKEAGIEVVPRVAEQPAWRWEWRTTAWGREGRVQATTAATPIANDARIEYARDGLVEWYENRKDGLEQGFTVNARPAGEGLLAIEGRLSDALRPVLDEAGTGLDLFDERGVRVLRYAGLVVLDAEAKQLDARLALAEGAVRILVDDRNAAYPIVIDPLMTTPSWTAESNQADAQFGIAVSTAGDVNHDGYSDVIVGAHLYDNGEMDEGRAYLYLGSASGLAGSPAWTAESDQGGAQFGRSVAVAGDVNGDGYSDVIVGAPLYDNEETDEGRAFLYLGSPSGLSASAAWTSEGDQVAAEFGNSLSTAGDVDGDGFSDVIVGAHLYDNGELDEGRAYVYLGSGSGLAASFAWTAESDQDSTDFGGSVATAGDVNGDGFGDVIVGARLYDNGEADEGRASVYLGSASGLAATPVWTAESDQAGADFGISVAGAGDVNGDGYGDVIVGADTYDYLTVEAGYAFVYFGSATGPGIAPAWTAFGPSAPAQFGYSVATAGDINGDGYADVIVGAPGFIPLSTVNAVGRAYVYLGSASGLTPNGAWVDDWEMPWLRAGTSVASAGDVNGDGYSDVIVGGPQFSNGQSQEGRAAVYLGSAAGLTATAGWTAEPNQASANFGRSVASAGDVNGDGYDDVIVGATLFDNGQTDEGRAFLFLGSAQGLSVSPDWTAESNQASSRFGQSVSAAGDVNGDGYGDVIVGAPFFDNGQTDEGRAFLYLGSATGLAAAPAWTAESDQVGAQFGNSAANVGDANGDGYGDVIVGAFSYDGLAGINTGRAYLYLGSASGLAIASSWIVEGVFGTQFAISVSSAGDVNGDGRSDAIIGAPQAGGGAGEAYVFLGSVSGLASSPIWTGTGVVAGSRLGNPVASAGDVNGDGYGDIIVGAQQYANGQTNEGRAYVYLGGPSGPSLTANWTTPELNLASAFLGGSVSSAGDVNGDGCSDVIIGAIGFANGQSNEGSAFVYLGSSTGLAATAGWTAEGNQVGALFGQSVAGAGDVNGDGFGDVIVGANQSYNGESNEGRAFVYYGNGGAGLDRAPQQWRALGPAPIGSRGKSDSNTEFNLKALARTAAGRGRVRMEAEVKPLLTPFDGTGTTLGAWQNTGAPSAGIGSVEPVIEAQSGLTTGAVYHWRMRFVSDSPFFPRSPWFSPSFNAPSEWDLRMGGGVVGQPPAVSGPQSVSVEEGGSISFTVTASDPDAEPITTLTANLSGLPLGNSATFVPNPGNTSGTFAWDLGADGTVAGTYVVNFTALNSLSGSHATSIVVSPRGVTIVAKFAWTPTASDVGTYPVTFTAKSVDGDSASATTQVTVTAAAANAPTTPLKARSIQLAALKGPIISAPTSAEVSAGSSLEVTVTASSSDTLTANTSDLPAGNTATFTVDRDPVLLAPVSWSADPGTTLSFGVTASDPDGEAVDTLTVDTSALPSGNNATFVTNGSHTSGTFSWTPGAADTGVFVVNFKAANKLVRYAATAITVGNHLFGYWRMNGNAADDAIGNALTPSGGVTFPTGQLGQAADIDGSADGQLTGTALAPYYNIDPSGFTFECLVKVRSLAFGVDPRVVFVGELGGDYWEMLVCDEGCTTGRAKFRLYMGGTVVALESNANIADGAWHHVATTYDGIDLKLYVDGLLDNTHSEFNLGVSVGLLDLVLGDTPSGANQFDGMIDDVRIWTRARSAAEILVAKDGERGFPTAVQAEAAPRFNDRLGQNRPNPFNPATKIEFDLAKAGHARIAVFDVVGSLVARLVDRELPAGRHEISWSGRSDDGRAVASGVYFYRLEIGGFKSTRRMILLK